MKNIEVLKDYLFEIGPIRPPNEGKDCSLLIRINRHCPYNRCLFCPFYKGKKFVVRKIEEIKKDIDTVKNLQDNIKQISWGYGLAGELNADVLNALLRNILGLDFDDLRQISVILGYRGIITLEVVQQAAIQLFGAETDETVVLQLFTFLQNLDIITLWLKRGGKTVFLQDSDALAGKFDELADIIKYLKQVLSSVERVTAYTRSKTGVKRTLDELIKLREAGLRRLHVGLESGCDEVLEFVCKGASTAEHIEAGQKIKQAGIELCFYVMPGLGGKKWSEKHARETAMVLNEVNPDFIRLRSLVISQTSPLYERYISGEFTPLSEDEVIDEIELLIENLDSTSEVMSDHNANLLMGIEGKLPDDKEEILKVIRDYKAKSLPERLEYQLKHRVGYYLRLCGQPPNWLAQRIEMAYTSIKEKKPEEAAKEVEETIFLLKADLFKEFV